MKVLTVSQIRELDAYTIENEPITSIDLMERAGSACTEWIADHFPACDQVVVFCGPGNNGGDGLVMARLLALSGWRVTVIHQASVLGSKDCEINLQRVKEMPQISIFAADNVELPTIVPQALVIDALFGSGLSRPLDGNTSDWVSMINALPNVVISIDIPSGLFGDIQSTGEAVEADFTLSLEVPKRAFLVPENHRFVGEWSCIPIGLDQEKLKGMESEWSVSLEEDALRLLQPRHKFDHKGTFGHALVIAGSYGKAGAAILASKGALHSGAGLVTAHVPGLLNPILQTTIPEVMVVTDSHQFHFTGVEELVQFTAVGIGCGIGQHADTVKALQKLFDSVRVPLVIDADALNIISQHQYMLKQLPKDSILTPHPKEFERLFGKSETHFDRLKKLRDAAMEYKIIIVLKGAHTAIADPTGHIHFNSTGNPGMATAGTGDVLTGILTGLVAQKIQPLDATILGVYLHGLAGDIAADTKGYEALIASDIIAHLADAFQYLHGIDDISMEDA